MIMQCCMVGGPRWDGASVLVGACVGHVHDV